MLKKFLSGAAFGAGFSITALCAYTVWMVLVLPQVFNQSFNSEMDLNKGLGSLESPSIESSTGTTDFYGLSIDEKINLSTAIIVVRHEKGDDGKYKSLVEDILKHEEGVELYYKVGETYEEHLYYELVGDFMPKRAIVFMNGNPATMRFSTTFDGERIGGLGGISMALLREKCSDT